jgi:uncharacterized protein YbjT (DUF2867 family)
VTGDLLAGEGLHEAVAGATTIIHCAGASKGDDLATQKLVEAAAHAGHPHLVFISVVGADRMPVEGPVDRMMFSYLAMKRRAEEVVAGSGLPWTIPARSSCASRARSPRMSIESISDGNTPAPGIVGWVDDSIGS